MTINQIRKTINPLAKVIHSTKFSTAFCLLIIAFGAFLRIHQYLDNRSLWLDEAMLSLNIVNRSFAELLQPLDYRQNAPAGFLILERFCVELFGSSEYALRLPSLIFGLLSLLLFYQVSKRYLNSKAVPFALGFFAISNPLIYYSSEVKQYSADVAVSLLILLVIPNPKTGLLTWAKALLWGVTSALVIWFSFTSIFVFVGGSICLILYYVKEKHWQQLYKLLIANIIWLFSAIALYFLFLARSVGNEALQRSWEWKGGFAPIPIFSPMRETFRWYTETFNDIFISPVGFAASGLAGMIFLAGCFMLILENKYKLSILLSPILLTILASSMQKYPFSTLTNSVQGGRLILFLVPSIIIIVAQGLEYFSIKLDKIVVVFMILILWLQPLRTALQYAQKPRVVEDVRPVIEYVLKKQKSFDMIYLYYRTKHLFEYYQNTLGFSKSNNIVRGLQVPEKNRIKYRERIESFRGRERIWFVFSARLDKHNNDKKFFLENLDIIGEQRDQIEKYGASAYLYDLSK